jgi:HEAT repeat protein
MTDDDLIQNLLDAIDGGEDERTEQAALACRGAAGLLPALRPLLVDTDLDRRWWAVRTLAVLGTPDAIPLLIELLADDDEAVRCAAAYGLGALNAEAGVPALAAALTDPSGWVRDSAADGLAQIGYPAVETLIGVLNGEHDGARVRAASALRRIVLPGERPGPGMDIHSPRGQALGALFRALQDSNYLVHQHAYDALNQLGLLDNLIVM